MYIHIYSLIQTYVFTFIYIYIYIYRCLGNLRFDVRHNIHVSELTEKVIDTTVGHHHHHHQHDYQYSDDHKITAKDTSKMFVGLAKLGVSSEAHLHHHYQHQIKINSSSRSNNDNYDNDNNNKIQNVNMNICIEKLYPLLIEYIDDMSAQSISNVIWSLGKMNVTYNRLPPILSKKFLHHMVNKAIDLNDQGLANIIWGMYKMKWFVKFTHWCSRRDRNHPK